MVSTSKRTRTRQVLDCVLIPAPSRYSTSSQLSAQEESFDFEGSDCEDSDPAMSSIQFTLEGSSFPFALTDEECCIVEKPANMSAGFNVELYMRFAFNIDMAKIPGRIRQPSNQTGK